MEAAAALLAAAVEREPAAAAAVLLLALLGVRVGALTGVARADDPNASEEEAFDLARAGVVGAAAEDDTPPTTEASYVVTTVLVCSGAPREVPPMIALPVSRARDGGEEVGRRLIAAEGSAKSRAEQRQNEGAKGREEVQQ